MHTPRNVAATRPPPNARSYAIAYASAYTAGSVQGGEGCTGQAEAYAKSEVEAHATVGLAEWAGSRGATLMVRHCTDTQVGLNIKLGVASLGVVYTTSVEDYIATGVSRRWPAWDASAYTSAKTSVQYSSDGFLSTSCFPFATSLHCRPLPQPLPVPVVAAAQPRRLPQPSRTQLQRCACCGSQSVVVGGAFGQLAVAVTSSSELELNIRVMPERSSTPKSCVTDRPCMGHALPCTWAELGLTSNESVWHNKL